MEVLAAPKTIVDEPYPKLETPGASEEAIAAGYRALKDASANGCFEELEGKRMITDSYPNLDLNSRSIY